MGVGRETKKPRILTVENKLVVSRGGRWGGWRKQVVGMKEGTFSDDHWVMNASAESLDCTPETNITLCVNSTGIKIICLKIKEISKCINPLVWSFYSVWQNPVLIKTLCAILDLGLPRGVCFPLGVTKGK